MNAATTTSPRRQRASLLLWCYVGVLAGCWAITVYRLGGLWSALPEYSYGWAVPILCVILFAERWRTRFQFAGNRLSARGPAVESSGSPPALTYFSICVAALIFLLARAAIDVMPTWRFAVWLLALSTVALTLLFLRLFASQFFGGSRFRVSHFAFPILFFLLAVPWPDRIEGPLIRTLTALNAASTVEVMSFLKVGAVQLGNIILIGPGMIGVQEACSGIRSFQSTVMVALFLGELFRFSFWRRVVFVLLGAFLSFLFNIVRTSFLVWVCNRDGLDAAARFHDPAGWTILAASVASLALIGWWLYRGQRKQTGKSEVRGGSVIEVGPASDSLASSFPASALSILVLCFLGCILMMAEGGTRWWLATHAQSLRASNPNFRMGFDEAALKLRPLKISPEARELLGYDRGTGWEWQGGGAERWQAFYFTWDKPRSLAREIACTSGATVHTPELCFTLAGMQLQQVFGKKSYQANGLPLVFKRYEFNDRGTPIFVFDCLWQRNVAQSVAEEQLSGSPSTGRGIRQAFNRFKQGQRGVTDEVRVLKFGVWGPRTLGEAEAAFQQQLNLLVAPKVTQSALRDEGAQMVSR